MTYLKNKTDIKKGSNHSYEINTLFFSNEMNRQWPPPRNKLFFQFFKYLSGIDDLGEHTG